MFFLYPCFIRIKNIFLMLLLRQAFAKRLVNADRCALFMLDSKSEELYANLFDEGDEDGSGYKFRNGAEIRWDLKQNVMDLRES